MRWEDYTNIVVDPSDDCTFWFARPFALLRAQFSVFVPFIRARRYPFQQRDRFP